MQRLFFGPRSDPLIAAHRVALNNRPVVMFSPAAVPSFRAVVPDVPGLHVLSLKMRNATSTMFRLQNLRMDSDVNVNLSSFFGISRVSEYGLSFASNYTAVQSNRLRFAPSTREPQHGRVRRHREVMNVAVNATVEAGMIRSFLVQ